MPIHVWKVALYRVLFFVVSVTMFLGGPKKGSRDKSTMIAVRCTSATRSAIGERNCLTGQTLCDVLPSVHIHSALAIISDFFFCWLVFEQMIYNSLFAHSFFALLRFFFLTDHSPTEKKSLWRRYVYNSPIHPIHPSIHPPYPITSHYHEC